MRKEIRVYKKAEGEYNTQCVIIIGDQYDDNNARITTIGELVTMITNPNTMKLINISKNVFRDFGNFDNAIQLSINDGYSIMEEIDHMYDEDGYKATAYKVNDKYIWMAEFSKYVSSEYDTYEQMIDMIHMSGFIF